MLFSATNLTPPVSNANPQVDFGLDVHSTSILLYRSLKTKQIAYLPRFNVVLGRYFYPFTGP